MISFHNTTARYIFALGRERVLPPVFGRTGLRTGAPERFRALDELFEDSHPQEPHHHLALLAVEPSLRGRGLGTALLRHHHASLDGTEFWPMWRPPAA